MGIKITQSNLSDQAYNKIKQLILDGVLKPGEKIIQEKMAKKLGISKILLIQALSVIQKERLLEYQDRKGFFVRKISLNEYFDLLKIRRALECLAVEGLIENLNENIKKELIYFLEGFKKYSKMKNEKKYYELDKKFHYYVNENSGNSYLKHINNSFNIYLLTFTKGFRTNIELSSYYHEKIIQMILSKKTDEAVNIVKEHIDNKKNHILKQKDLWFYETSS